MSQGLGNIQHVVLRQEIDQIEWCACPFPIPSKIGFPCVPCDRSNEFYLFQSNQTYEQLGMKIWDIEEESSCIRRTTCMPSMRPFKLTCKDFYNQIPATADRPLKIPCFSKQKLELNVDYQGKSIGKVVDPCSLKLCDGILQELSIYNEKMELQYTLKAKVKKSNFFLCLPTGLGDCEQITYKIYNTSGDQEGEVKHLYFGLYNEVCTKADQYGITFPDQATDQNKVLITMATVFIDYLMFENF